MQHNCRFYTSGSLPECDKSEDKNSMRKILVVAKRVVNLSELLKNLYKKGECRNL